MRRESVSKWVSQVSMPAGRLVGAEERHRASKSLDGAWVSVTSVPEVCTEADETTHRWLHPGHSERNYPTALENTGSLP